MTQQLTQNEAEKCSPEHALEDLSPDVIIDEESSIDKVNDGNFEGVGGTFLSRREHTTSNWTLDENNSALRGSLND